LGAHARGLATCDLGRSGNPVRHSRVRRGFVRYRIRRTRFRTPAAACEMASGLNGSCAHLIKVAASSPAILILAAPDLRVLTARRYRTSCFIHTSADGCLALQVS
jgi:hypothetical protein